MARQFLWSLVITVGLAPLPLASNRPWAWGLLGLAVGVQLVAFAIAALVDGTLIQMNWRRYAPIMLGFVVLVAWFQVQQSVLVPQAWRNPLWRDAGDLLGAPIKGSIAIDPGAARETILRLVSYAGVFFLALHLCRPRESARFALWSLALAGTVYAVYGLVVHVGGHDVVLWYPKWAYKGSLTSTFVNRNSFAAYCGLTLIATLDLLLKESEHGMRYGIFNRHGFIHFIDTITLGPFVLLVAAVVIATALLFTQSRGGFFSTAIGVMALAFAIRLPARRRGADGRLPIFALSLAIAAVILVSFSGSNLMGRLGDFAASEKGRSGIYALTLRAIGDQPLLGVGLGGFHDAFQMYRDSRLDQEVAIFDRAHNTYLELALEAGLPALALMLAILGGIAFVCARGLVTRQRDFVYPAAGLGVTALMAVHSVVDFSLQIPAIAVAYALLVGTAYAQSFSSQRQPSAKSDDGG
jgi:O-antigen ligase